MSLEYIYASRVNFMSPESSLSPKSTVYVLRVQFMSLDYIHVPRVQFKSQEYSL